MSHIQVNGRTIHQHKGTRFHLKSINYKIQLESIRTRLQNDVGTIFGLIDTYNSNHEAKIGFFSSIRMLMPIIDSLATLQGIDPEEVFGGLDGVPVPHLMWNLYRDMFMHNDEFPLGFYHDLVVPTGIVMTASDDSQEVKDLFATRRWLDSSEIYRSLVNYMNALIDNADKDEERQVIEGIEYLDDPPTPEVQAIISEINEDTSTYGRRMNEHEIPSNAPAHENPET